MLPNCCLTQNSNNRDYNTNCRAYQPRETNKSSLYVLRTLPRHNEPVQPLREYSGKRVKRARKLRKVRTPRASSKESSPLPTKRRVNFELPHEAAESAKNVRKPAGLADSHTGPDPNRELQESCADFFTVVHDNVLEAVQGAVERMACKYFQDTMDKVDKLAEQLTRQDALLTKIYQDFSAKIAEQNETSINQFKFLAQMLIDNQTVHYRTLYDSQKRHKRSRHNNSNSNLAHAPRCTGGDNQASHPAPPHHLCQQHQLCQQQERIVYDPALFSCNHHCVLPDTTCTNRQPTQHTRPHRTPKNEATASMPNLQRSPRISSSGKTATTCSRPNPVAHSPHRMSQQRNPQQHYTHTHSNGQRKVHVRHIRVPPSTEHVNVCR